MSHLRMTPEEYARAQARGTNRAGEPSKAKRAKFGNVKTSGADSKKEHMRKVELAHMVKAGLVRDLRHQVPYAMVHDGQLVCQYVADHVYFDVEAGVTVVEDTKSPPTRADKVYQLKRKMMKIFHKIEVRET